MKPALVCLLLSCILLRAQVADGTASIGGKLKTFAEIERTILQHAREHQIRFDFDAAPREVRTYTNGPVAVAIYSTHPSDGSFFSGRIEHSGKVSCDWWAILGPETTNATVQIRGKRKSASEVERLLLGYAQKQKVGFDFKGARRRLIISTESPGSMSILFEHPGEGTYYHAGVDGRGKVWYNMTIVCGGMR